MSRQEKLYFDYNDYFEEMFEATAVLMWNTHYPVYTFAFYLNQIFGLRLERKDDVLLTDKEETQRCSVYSWIDNCRRLTYFLIDIRDDGAAPKRKKIYFDKVLLVIGSDARETAMRILGDLEPSTLFDNDPLRQRRDALLRTFIDNGIFESASFDFSDPDHPRTSYFPEQTENTELANKRRLFLKKHREFVGDMILALDRLLPDYESDSAC